MKGLVLVLVFVCVGVCFGEGLFDAVENGEVETVRRMIDDGIDLDQRNQNGETALVVAAKSGLLEMVRVVLEGMEMAKLQELWKMFPWWKVVPMMMGCIGSLVFQFMINMVRRTRRAEHIPWGWIMFSGVCGGFATIAVVGFVGGGGIVGCWVVWGGSWWVILN